LFKIKFSKFILGHDTYYEPTSINTGFSLRQDISLKDMVYVPPLPNIAADDLYTCLGSMPQGVYSLEDLAKKVVSSFWSSEFNRSLARTRRDGRDLYISKNEFFMETWKEMSKNPNWNFTKDQLLPAMSYEKFKER